MASIIIKDNSNGKEYKLEYNRNALIKMEEMDFNIKEVKSKPLKSITILIRGAFIKNHPDMEEDKIDAIISQIGDLDKLVEALANMYADAMNSIISSNKENTTKNITWGKN